MSTTKAISYDDLIHLVGIQAQQRLNELSAEYGVQIALKSLWFTVPFGASVFIDHDEPDEKFGTTEEVGFLQCP